MKPADDTHRSSRVGARATTVIVVCFTLLLAAAGAFGVLWLRDESLSVVQPTASAVWVEASLPSEPISRALTFELHLAPDVDLPSSGAGGTITAVNVAPGDVLDPSTVAPFEVDGLPRPWFLSLHPLFRPVAFRTTGEDVDELAGWLDQQGFVTGHVPGSPVGSSFMKAVRAWAEGRGFGRRVDAFSPEWVTWLPQERLGLRVKSVNTIAGASLPSFGSPVMTLGGGIAAATPADGDTPASSPLPGSKTSIFIGGQAFEYDGGALSEEAVRALEDEVPVGQETVQLVAEDSFAAGVVAVPSTAIWMPSDEQGCIVVAADSSGRNATSRKVRVLGGKAGSAFVANVEGFVLANPSLLARTLCK